jgi:hypothetical protein
VAYFLEVGLLLMVVPWSDFWADNYFAQTFPALAPIITNAFVCGAISGLGIANILIGVADLGRLFSARAGDFPPAGPPHFSPRPDSRSDL